MPDLMLLAINLTRRCNLGCAHCYLDAGTRQHDKANELTTGQVCGILDDVVKLGGHPMVVLTGGEPLLRGDIEEIAAHGSGKGLPIVVGTNGLMLTGKRVRSLQAAGVIGMGISVDSLNADFHDQFRGCPGAWSRTMAGIEACRTAGMSFQIHFTVTNDNADELAAMIDFSRAVGARVLNVFFLVCTGRGGAVHDISRHRYEQVLNQLIEAQAQYQDIIIRPRCAPHFKRVAYQRDSQVAINRIAGSAGDGCIAATGYCRITPEGGVTPCPYIEQEAGNLKSGSLVEIWRNSPTFEALRNPQLRGACGKCEFRLLCGGCRARPVAQGGSLMDSDPVCTHVPSGGPAIEPLGEAELGPVMWSGEAEARLERIPPFLRPMVRKRAEAYASERGAREVTTNHLEVLSARRFGKKPSLGVRP